MLTGTIIRNERPQKSNKPEKVYAPNAFRTNNDTFLKSINAISGNVSLKKEGHIFKLTNSLNETFRSVD